MKVKITMVDKNEKHLAYLPNLVAITDKFFLFKDDEGSLRINLTKHLKIENQSSIFAPTIEELLLKDKVFITSKTDKIIFIGPPWNSNLIADFLIEAKMI